MAMIQGLGGMTHGKKLNQDYSRKITFLSLELETQFCQLSSGWYQKIAS